MSYLVNRFDSRKACRPAGVSQPASESASSQLSTARSMGTPASWNPAPPFAEHLRTTGRVIITMRDRHAWFSWQPANLIGSTIYIHVVLVHKRSTLPYTVRVYRSAVTSALGPADAARYRRSGRVMAAIYPHQSSRLALSARIAYHLQSLQTRSLLGILVIPTILLTRRFENLA
jgi:hypothetical protein